MAGRRRRRGRINEDPGPDLASYPLSQVPDEAAGLVRALLTADRNQQYLRLRMTEAQRAATPAVDFRPFIIADADTGHGGDPHVRNLIRRFVEAGVPGYHIEDQRPGTKKCGHQGGKVLVPSDEQIKRLNTARFQLDIMRVPGIIVARTDAEAANLIDGRADERDQPFLLGVTNLKIPSYKSCFLAMVRSFYEAGVTELNGHLLYALPEGEYATATAWLERQGIAETHRRGGRGDRLGGDNSVDELFDDVESQFVEAWQNDAGLQTYGEAVAELLEFREREGEPLEMSAAEWRRFAERASLYEAREKAKALGADAGWDCERVKTPEGYYQIRGGIPYAIAKSLAAAPFADILWMETKTADLDDAREFADAIHAVYPDKMLAYNLSPSFNWDTTGMSDDEMRAFPEELGKMGFVFNFMTYGGHQIDGVAAEEFATALQAGRHAVAGAPAAQDASGRIALPHAADTRRRTAQRCRAGRLVGAYRDHQVDGQGLHPAPASRADRGAEEAAGGMARDVERALPDRREAPRPVAAAARGRRGARTRHLRRTGRRRGEARQRARRSHQGPHGRSILTVRDQNTFAEKLRQKRLMTLVHLWLVHRFKADALYYVTPTEDNVYQTEKMKSHGIFRDVQKDVGEIIVAEVNQPRIDELLAPDQRGAAAVDPQGGLAAPRLSRVRVEELPRRLGGVEGARRGADGLPGGMPGRSARCGRRRRPGSTPPRCPLHRR